MTGETLAGFSLYKVSRESVTKNSNLLVFSFPRGDSDSTATFDFMGATLNITVEGLISNRADIDTFFTNFLGGPDLTGGLADGTQDSTVEYLGGNSISANVKVDAITTTYSAGEPDVLRYNIKLIQAGI